MKAAAQYVPVATVVYYAVQGVTFECTDNSLFVSILLKAGIWAVFSNSTVKAHLISTFSRLFIRQICRTNVRSV